MASSLESLRKTFKGDLVVPSDPDYSNAIARWAVNAQRNAELVAFVNDADDVVQAIKFAKDHNFPIAIRGGGHSASGESSVEGGLVIDLSRHLNGVKVDPERKVACVGGGAIWETVDKAAIEHGLATVGGSVNHTGVGGAVLGGGYGILSASFGLAIDNLLQATVVTADGSILTANDTEYPDLFWALKGGGCNFGVVVEFILQLHPQRRTVFAGNTVFPPPALESVATAVKKWWEAVPSEKEAIFQFAARGPDGNPFICLLLVYNGTEDEGRAVFKSFFDLKPFVDTCQEIPYEKLNSLNNEMAAPGKCRYSKSVYETTARPEVVAQELSRLVSLSVGPVKLTALHEYIPMQKISSIAPDATAFPMREPKCSVAILSSWEDDSEENLKFAQAATEELLSFTINAEKVENNIGYGNFSNDQVQMSTQAILLFRENYPRLQHIKKQYDPQLLFNKWFVIVPS